MSEYSLGFWGRIGVLIVGSGIVLISILVVACVVGPHCWLHNLFLKEEEKEKRRLEKERLFYKEAPSLVFTKLEDDTGEPVRHSTVTFSEKTQEFCPKLCLTSPGSDSIPPTEVHPLLQALTNKRDSTYSSMSENSGRTSPTNSCKSSAADSASGSTVGSPVGGGESMGQISFTLQYVVTSEDRGTGRLIITVVDAKGLCGRTYMGGACDPYVKVILWKEKRSIRKSKSTPLHEFRTRTVRHTTSPTFDQSFAVDMSKTDLRELTLKLVAMDSDKWTSPSTLGEVTQPLREVKSIVSSPEKVALSYFLAPPKLDLGEVLFGLSYLPTAQRLSVSVIKAHHLKFNSVVDDVTAFAPYIRVILVSTGGRVLRRKKTTHRAATDHPVWNETLIFDLAQHQVEQVTFILAVCNRTHSVHAVGSEDPDSQSPDVGFSQPEPRGNKSLDGSNSKRHDKYLGKVVLGSTVRESDTKSHWIEVLCSPRKVVSRWHPLQ